MRYVTSRIPLDCSRPLTPYELIERARQARALKLAEDLRRRNTADAQARAIGADAEGDR